MKRLQNNLRLRILTPMYFYYEHNHNIEFIRCAGDKCPMCLAGFGRNPVYVMGAIDRADQKYYVYEVDRTTYLSLRAFTQDRHWGALSGYDVLFQEAMTFNVSFSVEPYAKSNLSAQDQEIINNINSKDIEDAVCFYPIDCVKGFMRRRNLYKKQFSPFDKLSEIIWQPINRQ